MQIYSALLVFVTQKLSTRRNLQRDRTLTATHDNAAAWAGLGSAIFHLWHQKVVPASIISVLSVFLYLGNILVLHITTPALFSLQTFNSSRSADVKTEGLPGYNWSTNIEDDYPIFQAQYALGSLYFLPSVLAPNSTSPGLYEGTLYDVPEPNLGSGNVTVNATGFNISCGYLTDMNMTYLPNALGSHWVFNGSDFPHSVIANTQPGLISMPLENPTLNSIMLYSTIPIVDSNNNQGGSVRLIPTMNTSVTSLQLLRCFQSLVSQTVVVDAQSRQIIPGTVPFPEIEKTASTWSPYAGPVDFNTPDPSSGNSFIDAWGAWYEYIPASDFPLANATSAGAVEPYASVADFYLIQRLNMRPSGKKHPSASVTLHDLENALSILAASMFWTLGHIPPTHGQVQSVFMTDEDDDPTNVTISLPIEAPPSPFFLEGKATVTEIFTQIRLDLSIVAIVAGLVASLGLTLLSLPSSLHQGTKDSDAEDIPIDGMGLLHAMWLFRNHPELESLLRQVEYPTNDNLRDAGMVRTRLVGGQVRKRRSLESFDAERLYK
ncbi:hypothetical protein C8R44DRAFT_704083 [Mycena epipterygia]|nr:hypothetical protein C8R44DRAFT_704083 [Mycena epipterygia]